MKTLLPGATIGMLGGGQLGRMFTLAARSMGYRVHVYTSKPNSPTAQVADFETVAKFDDIDAIEKFARSVDVVTYEFENVPAAAVQMLEKTVPTHPSSKVLFTAQHRLREKTFLSENGFPVARFYAVSTAEDLEKGLQHTGTPAILKTAGFGYDGKGQAQVHDLESAIAAWDNLDRTEAVLEEKVLFDSEVSLVASRNAAGEFAHFGLIQNDHRNHILHLSQAPANAPESLHESAAKMVRELCEALEVVGVICVEFFRRGDELIINEIAPRPHNSGHLTIEACQTSQFEQQLRAVCGLPPGPTNFLSPAAMVNLLGDLWENGEPDWEKVLSQSGLHLHLYGKGDARVGRKMGHITALGETAESAKKLVEDAFRKLGGGE
jgi:5-(carboxyamino)imidazole ribonucleotide synthase